MRFLLILALCLLFIGCSANEPIDGQGVVFEVEGDRILVLERIEPEHAGKTWNDILGDYEGRAIWLKTSASGLQVGQKVNYWIDGPVAESYPEQAQAKKIEVIE